MELCFQPPAYFVLDGTTLLRSISSVFIPKDNRNSVSKFQYFCSSTLPNFKEQELSHLRCRFSHLYHLLIAEKSP